MGIYDVIFISFLGPSNAGKTTIINDIIREDILPADLNESTKRGIIIRYFDDNETEINIRKVNFIEEEFLGKKKYYFESQDIIAKGLKGVQETVKGLNYDFNKKEEDSFYYIRTKIKLFDDLGLDNYYKKMIYLIDFPGYGTNNVFELELYKKVISICNSFIFVVKNSVIKETLTKDKIEEIFREAMEQKKKLPSGFIKSCLFILNNDNTQTKTEEDLEIAKEDINSIIKQIDKKNINVSFFNAKYYLNYIINYNFFFKIQNTFQKEYKKFFAYKNDIFVNPEKYNNKKFNSFCEFINKEIVDRIKNEGLGNKISNNEKLNGNIKNDIEEAFNQIELYNYNNNIDSSKKYIDKFGKLFSFAQNNINNLKTFKDSNVEEFKKQFLNQINNVNNDTQKELKDNIDSLIKTLDYFFKEDFTEREKDLKAYIEFQEDLQVIIKQMNNLTNNCQNRIKSMRRKYEENAINSLKNKMANSGELLKKKNLEEIKKEINSDLKNYMNNLKKEFKLFFEDIDYNSLVLYKKAKNKFSDFSEAKITLDEYSDFRSYLSEKVSNKKDTCDEINGEIENCMNNSMNKIYKEKGFFSAISSFFSNSSYLSNIIEIIIKYYSSKVKYYFDLLRDHFIEYIKNIINLIETRKTSIVARYKNQKSEEWKTLCSIYLDKRDDIYKDLNVLIKK